MSVAAVAFDLDYTLAVPERKRAEILVSAAEEAGAPPLEREAYLDAHRRNLTRETRTPIFADLLADTDADADPADVARVYREQIADALRPIDGAEALLATLRNRYRVGLLTNGPIRAQRDKIETLGWEDRFDVALVTGELPAGKPDPRAFEALAAALDASPEEIIYVGDERDADVVGATEAGFVAVQVLFDDGPEPDPLADAHIPRTALVERLPRLIAEFDEQR